jgi:diguanylate cyclase (GGDEF)-like protein
VSRPSPVEAVAELGRRALHTDDVDEMLRTATDIVGATLSADRTFVTADGAVVAETGACAEPRSEIEVAIGARVAFGRLCVQSSHPDGFGIDDETFLRSVSHLLSACLDRHSSEAATRRMAMQDPLTGLPNRTHLVERIDAALGRARVNGSLVALLMVDLDQFKVINDSLGHQTGDSLLIAVPPRLRAAIGAHDCIARLGGDEFAVLVEDLTSEAEALAAARRLGDAWSHSFPLGVDEVYVTGSVGVAVAGARDASSSTLLREADAAMYRAKEQGRGRFELFDEVMRARALDRLRLESDLRRALENDELDLAYQPVYEIETGRPVAVEALLRWRHPTRGPVSPAEFVPVAEDSGLIVPIGRWVLQKACGQVAAWRRRLPADVPLRLCVNLSARHVARPEVVSDVALALRTSGLPPECLALEITESVLMEEGETAQAALGDLRGLGVALYLDDFGTGYSSLGYLRRFPLDALKIDRSFVEGITDSTEARELIGAIIAMARGLGLLVVAEGVETAAQLAQLAQLGCPRAQGFHLAPPLPAEEAAALLVAQIAPVRSVPAGQAL